MGEPIGLEMRPIPEQLRYWARQLAEGMDELALRAVAASIALVIIADELEQDGERARQARISARERRMLGKRVRVHLDGSTVSTGRLLGFGQGGDFEIEEDDGMVHYCWPALSMEGVAGDPDDTPGP